MLIYSSIESAGSAKTLSFFQEFNMNNNKLAYFTIALLVGSSLFRYIDSKKKLKEAEQLRESVSKSLEKFDAEFHESLQKNHAPL